MDGKKVREDASPGILECVRVVLDDGWRHGFHQSCSSRPPSSHLSNPRMTGDVEDGRATAGNSEHDT